MGVKLATLEVNSYLGDQLVQSRTPYSDEHFQTSCVALLRQLGLHFDVTVEFDIRVMPLAAGGVTYFIDITAPRLI